MTTVRKVMTTRIAVVDDDASIEQAARTLARSAQDVVPVRGASDARLKGMVTDRDIVEVVASGKSPSWVTVSEIIADAAVVAIGADDDLEQAEEAMRRHEVSRLPVVDGHSFTGIITKADIANSQGTTP
jgi:CBS domain-containing protein